MPVSWLSRGDVRRFPLGEFCGERRRVQHRVEEELLFFARPPRRGSASWSDAEFFESIVCHPLFGVVATCPPGEKTDMMHQASASDLFKRVSILLRN